MRILAAIAGFVLVLTGCTLAQRAEPTPDAFSISFQSPANGAELAEGVPYVITLTAQDSAGSGVARVDLLVDDTLLQRGNPVEAIAVPLFTVEMNWTPLGPGLHSLTAQARRTDGTMTETAISVNVLPASGASTPALTPNSKRPAQSPR